MSENVHINLIEKFFNEFDFTKCNCVQVNKWTKVLNIRENVNLQISLLKQNAGNPRFINTYTHLLELYYVCVDIKENNYLKQL